MLSQAMVEHLNEQINLEFFSSNLYLQMSAWCEDKGFDGAAEFLRAHAVEEMQHMQRLFTYVSETGALPILGAIAAPRHDFASLGEVFRETYQHEQKITQQINKLAHVARSPPKTTQHLTSFSGTWLNSTKKRSCLKGF
ncbi:ferritin [Vibrio cholerae]|nr:ferritin [Vibrio cholerae]